MSPDELIVAQVARFHPVKDHTTAISAWAYVQQQLHETNSMNKATLLLVGDGELRDKLEAQVRESGLSDRVKFLGVRRDVHRLLAGVDVFLLSSLSEGISVTLLEAMGSALPIAATAVGGNPEVVEHGTTGLLSPRQDSQALALNLLTLLRDAPLCKSMGLAGRQRLLDKFTQQHMHARYSAIYDEMLKR
ncbi:MAG: glycosyltransferase [Phycisphaerales bacterium]|nr:glycosyltransferase [Phycisphaerales bacterium]